jgi:hypothetical protein
MRWLPFVTLSGTPDGTMRILQMRSCQSCFWLRRERWPEATVRGQSNRPDALAARKAPIASSPLVAAGAVFGDVRTGGSSVRVVSYPVPEAPPEASAAVPDKSRPASPLPVVLSEPNMIFSGSRRARTGTR